MIGSRMGRVLAFPLALVLSLLAVSRPGGARAAGLPVYGGEIRVPREPGPLELDPLGATTPLSRTLAHALFDTLLRIGPDGKPAPHLALRYEMSRDGLLCRLWLRPEVTFHDGSALTAREVKTSLERLLAPASMAWWLLAEVDGADEFRKGAAGEVRGIDVRGSYELEIRLAKPTNVLPFALCSPRASIVKLLPGGGGGSTPGPAGHAGSAPIPIGTGPFRLFKVEGDGAVVLEAFEDHFDGGPYFDRVRLAPIQSSRDQGLALEIGTLDLAFLEEGGIEGGLKPGYPFVPVEGTTLFAQIRARGPFAEPSARAALNYAVDRAAIADVLLRGQGEPARGLLPPGLAPYSSIRQVFPYDLGLARALKGGTERVRAKLIVPSGSPLARRVAERLQVNLLDIGIEVGIEEADPRAARDRFQAGSADLMLDSWSPEVPDPTLSLVGIVAEWAGPGSEGPLAVAWPLVEASMAASTATQAVRALYQAERGALAQVPWLLLVHPRSGFVVSPRIVGLECDFGGALHLEDAWRHPPSLREE